MRPSLLDLPVEIINLIALHLEVSCPVKWHLIRRNRPVCACGPLSPPVSEEEDEDEDEDRDNKDSWGAVLDLSMVCKRLREVIFEGKIGRVINVGICDRAMELSAVIPQRARERVRTLHLRADNDHVPPTHAPNLYEYLDLYPNLQQLEIHWKLQFSQTPLSLAPHSPPADPEARTYPLSSLRLIMGDGNSDCAAEPDSCPLAMEMADIIKHLVLPDLKELFIEFNLGSYGIEDQKSSWNTLALYLALIRRFRALEEVTIKIQFQPSPNRPYETDYWEMLLAVSVVISTASRLKSLHFALDFDFWLHDDLFTKNADGKFDLPTHFLPGEQDVAKLLAGPLALCPSLEKYTLSIDGSTTYEHWELTYPLFRLDFRNRPDEPEQGSSPFVWNCGKYVWNIDRLHHVILKAREEFERDFSALDTDSEGEEEERLQEAMQEEEIGNEAGTG